MDIVDRLREGFCGFKDVLLPAATEITELRTKLAAAQRDAELYRSLKASDLDFALLLWKGEGLPGPILPPKGWIELNGAQIDFALAPKEANATEQTESTEVTHGK